MNAKFKLIAATCFGIVAFASSALFFMRGPMRGNVIVLYLVLPTLCGVLAGYVWGGPILDPLATPTSGKALLRGLGITVRAYLIFSVLFACGLPMFETLWSPGQAGGLFLLTLTFGFVMVGPTVLLAGALAGIALYLLAHVLVPPESS